MRARVAGQLFYKYTYATFSYAAQRILTLFSSDMTHLD